MNDKFISAATRENGKRQMQKIVERRAQAAFSKAIEGKKISVEEKGFKIEIGGLNRTCFKRFCHQCSKEINDELCHSPSCDLAREIEKLKQSGLNLE